jgi:hypothetical protein
VAKVGTSKAGGTISQQAAVHLWLAADAQGNKQTNKNYYLSHVCLSPSVPMAQLGFHVTDFHEI